MSDDTMTSILIFTIGIVITVLVHIIREWL